MKNIFKFFGIIVLVTIIGFVAVACGGGGKLSGTYSSKDGSMSYTFSGNKVVAEAFGQKMEGTYELKDGKFSITKDGKTESYNYTLEGNTLTYTWHGTKISLTKK